jgi:hypothetical protein
MSFSRSIQRLIAKNKQKEFEQRANQFIKEYKELVRKHRCDWRGVILPIQDGRQAVAQLTIIDATEMLEKDNADKDKISEKHN